MPAVPVYAAAKIHTTVFNNRYIIQINGATPLIDIKAASILKCSLVVLHQTVTHIVRQTLTQINSAPIFRRIA